MKEHPHAWALREIADGAPISDYEVQHTKWIEGEGDRWDNALNWNSWISLDPENWQVRRKQKTITVNGFEVPEPVRKALKKGVGYWIAFPSIPELAWDFQWDGDIYDRHRLNHGLIHLTKEAAIAHAKAMLGIDPRSEE
jgi:hypothetical protein